MVGFAVSEINYLYRVEELYELRRRNVRAHASGSPIAIPMTLIMRVLVGWPGLCFQYRETLSRAGGAIKTRGKGLENRNIL